MCPSVPVVWMSGYPRDFAFEGGEPSVDPFFLQKPILPEPLLKMVQEALAGSATR